MNPLDIVLLILFIPGIIRGLRKGILEQAISLVGIVLGVWLAFRYHDKVGAWLQTLMTASESIIQVVSFAGILVAVILVVLIISRLLTRLAEMATLGWLNRVLGMVFALATTALVLGILIILFDTVNTKLELVTSPILTESLLYGVLRDLGYFVFPFLKQIFTLGA